MSEHKKKRSREEDEANGVRKHKRNKSQAPTNGDDGPEAQLAAEAEEAELRNVEEPKRKKKKSKHGTEQNGDEPIQSEKKKSKKAKETPQFLCEEKVVDSDDEAKPQPEVDKPQDEPQEERPAKKHKKSKKKNVEEPVEDAMEVDVSAKKSKKEKKRREAAEAPVEDEPELPAPEEVASERTSKGKYKSKNKRTQPEDDAMSLDDPEDLISDVDFPFYTQTVALYLPIYPAGFGSPITAACQQHLDPMLNHYSPILGGVALSYKNVNVGESPVRGDPENPPSDENIHAELRSIDEYAVGFGYVTADFDLFKPSRGAWMEGRINLQTDGHIGLVCWDRFNASVEAKRLPPGWTWVEGDESADEPATTNGEDVDMESITHNNDEEKTENGDVKIHSSGYWANAQGERVTGHVRFRIQAFDAGTAGDHGYMSIRGTMLSAAAERALARQERDVDRTRRAKLNPFGVLRPMSRKLPEASMTNFAPPDAEETGTGRKGPKTSATPTRV